jgi:signal transduction histidine kinase
MPGNGAEKQIVNRAEPLIAGRPSAAVRSLVAAAVASMVVGLAVTIMWIAAGGGYYWPRWVWLAGLTLVAPPAIAAHLQRRPRPRQALAAHADTAAALCVYTIVIWCIAGARAPFWPAWVIASVIATVGGHALLAYLNQLGWFAGSRALSQRVDTLTRTRRGALEVQDAQLRRIERDLHDGAQARLVALTMHLGRAEARLGHDPDTATLVRAARAEAASAITELRDLVRGIAPPVLADRGLPAALRSLAQRSAVPVTITDTSPTVRLPPAVENAAYFVAAEALTNVAKHASPASAHLTLVMTKQTLIIEVSDNGPGGAIAEGNGLVGLRARVEALDGTFTVVSPVGGPTLIRAELPCES